MPSNTAAIYVLHGQIVTMDDASRVLVDGKVYVSGKTIAAVQPADQPPPAAFQTAKVIDTKGTIYPGLIELHNHLSYNALPLWTVPQKYGNRDQWPTNPQYHQLVTGPMTLLGKSQRKDLLAAIVRYVESKCLFAGVTTSQGIALSSNAGIESYYKGVVRNVESTGDNTLPPARTHIADVEAKDWDKFFAAVSGQQVMILHLAEGKDAAANAHFQALKKGNQWAITDRLVGIHCAGLLPPDFDVLAKNGGSMVWSPFSNYLLYGDTAQIVAARKSGVQIALGADWSPSGSKNLLGELKVARLVADQLNAGISDQDLVAMVTTTPAKMIKWDAQVGSLSAGKRADLVVIDKAQADPYKLLIASDETDVALVVIDGVARYGARDLMTALGATLEDMSTGGDPRGVQYHDPIANPDIDSVTLDAAEHALENFFGGLPNPPKPAATKSKLNLALVELDTSKAQRPLLPLNGVRTGWTHADHLELAAANQLPLIPIAVDALTVVDDPKFGGVCAAETNLPTWLKAGLKKLIE